MVFVLVINGINLGMAICGQWLFTKYDKFGRAVYTGFYNSTQTRAELQDIADDWVTTDGLPQNEFRASSTTSIGDTDLVYSNQSFPNNNLQVLSANYYDDYSIGDPDMPTQPTSVLGQAVTTNTKGLPTISWTRVLDGSSGHWNKTYTFYDQRGRAISVHALNYQGGYTVVDSELDFRGKVLKTISKHKKDTTAQLVSIEDRYGYDHMERVRTQEQTVYDGDTNSTNSTDRIVSGLLYDALGQLAAKYVQPESDGFGWEVSYDDSSNTVASPSMSDPAIIVSRDFDLSTGGIYDVSYDFSGDASGLTYAIVLSIFKGNDLVYRATHTATELEHAIDFVAATAGVYTAAVRLVPPNGTLVPSSNFAGTYISMVSNTSLPTPAATVVRVDVPALQRIDYKYNARGSMTDINDVDDLQDPSTGSGQDDLFAYRMHYDQPTLASGAMPMYNGNVAETQWKTRNDNVLRGYAYHYDALSRLTSAHNAEANYKLNTVSYDKNGNILSLSRNTFGGGTDTFNYTYDDGNRLLSVSGSKTAAYTYDANGNMLSDSSKGVTSISYNHLDLPETVTFASGDVIAYLYDAVGNKLKKTVTQSGNTSVTEYWDGFQYLQDNLQFFAQPEGYIAVDQDIATNARTFSYVYSYADHLGNVRLSYSDLDGDGGITVAEIVKESNYYPFGLLHQGYNNVVHAYGSMYNYGFGGKELQQENGIGWLDFGSRNYDPELGRWMNIDPQAGRYHNLSPFAGMGNNPIIFVDPNGEELVTGTAILIGAVAGAIIGGASVAIANPRADFGDIFSGALIGAFSGAVTAGIGQYYAAGETIVLGAKVAFLEQAAVHALFQGGLSAAQGGDFWQGAASAAASSLVGTATAGGDFAARSAVGAFTGGAIAEITGGDFVRGFATGLTVVALNHVLHEGANALQNDDCCGGVGDPVLIMGEISDRAAVYMDQGYDPEAAYKLAATDLGIDIVATAALVFDILTIPSGEGFAVAGGLKLLRNRIFGLGGNIAAKSSTKLFGKTVQQTTTRMGRDGKAVEIIFKDGSKIDINAARVKQWIPNTHPKAPAGTLQKVKFPNSLPGSKGYKRLPTQQELDILKGF